MNRRYYPRRGGNYGGGRRGGRSGFYIPRDLFAALAEDPVKRRVYSIISSIFILLLAVGGLCAWPYLIENLMLEGKAFWSQPAGKVLISAAAGGGVGFLLSIYLCWFFEWSDANEFSFIKIWMIVYAAVWVISMILVLVLGGSILVISNLSGWSNVLGFMHNGVLAAMLALIPSFLSALIGYLMNALWYFTHRHLE